MHSALGVEYSCPDGSVSASLVCISSISHCELQVLQLLIGCGIQHGRHILVLLIIRVYAMWFFKTTILIILLAEYVVRVPFHSYAPPFVLLKTFLSHSRWLRSPSTTHSGPHLRDVLVRLLWHESLMPRLLISNEYGFRTRSLKSCFNHLLGTAALRSSRIGTTGSLSQS